MKGAAGDQEIESPNAAFAGGETNTAAAHKSRKMNMYSLGLGVFLLLNVIVLYILHFADKDSSSSSSSNVSAKVSSDALQLSSTKSGQAVSVSATGKVSVGAGTTAFLAASKLPNDKPLTWVDLLPMGVGETEYKSNIMTYSFLDDKKTRSFVTTVSLADGNSVTVAEGTEFTAAPLKRGATLSNSLAVFLTVDAMNMNNGLVLATIADGKVTIVEDSFVANATTSSAAAYISRLSDTSFVVTYYGKYVKGGTWGNYARVGTVADNKITLSEGFSFAPENDELKSTTINPPQTLEDSTSFVVPWYVTNSTDGLCLEVFAVQGSSLNSSKVCNSLYKPAYFVQATSLTKDSIALAFYNEADNYALTISTVQLGAFDKKPVFRNTHIVENSRGAFDFGNAYGFSPNPTLSLLSGDRLSVSFLNPSNGGKPSVTIVSVGSDLALTSVASALPVIKSSFQLANTGATQAMGGVYMDSVATPNGVLVSYSGKWADSVVYGLPLVQSLGKPLGLTSGDKVQVSGVVEVDGLKAGNSYYASASGKLFGVSGTPQGAFIYADENTVLSTDSFVGVAVDSNKLMVSA